MNNERISNARSSLAAYGLMLAIMVYIGRVHELLPGTGRWDVGKFAIGVTVLLYLAMPKTGAGVFSRPQSKYLLGILALVILSIPLSIYPGGSVDFLTTSYSKNIVFFFLAAAIVNSAADIKKITTAVAISILSLSIAVLLKHNEARAYASNTYDPNDMAFVLVTLLPMVYYRMKASAGPAKLALAGVVVAALLACIRTVSRGGLLGVCAVSGFIYLKQGKSIRGAVLPAIALAVVFISFAPQTYWHRMDTMMNPDSDYNVTDSTGRIDVWKRGIRMMVTHPLLGVGANQFDIAEGRMHEGKGKWSAAHNSFIQIGAELGVLGLFLFVKMLYSSFMSLREFRKRDKDGVIPAWMLDGVEAAFVGYAVTGFFLSQAYSAVLLLLVALTVAAGKILDAHEKDAALATRKGGLAA